MQTKEVEALRKAWGNKPCDHPHTVREHYLGSHSEDKVCTTCGRTVYEDEKPSKPVDGK